MLAPDHYLILLCNDPTAEAINSPKPVKLSRREDFRFPNVPIPAKVGASTWLGKNTRECRLRCQQRGGAVYRREVALSCSEFQGSRDGPEHCHALFDSLVHGKIAGAQAGCKRVH